MKKTKWAIVGTGYIANEFAKGLMEVEDSMLIAVCSRGEASGSSFAKQYGCEKSYTNYRTMLEQENIDVVYIATPNDCHYAYVEEALDKEIPVLCEKPMMDNGWQMDKIIAKAKEKNVFLMEGMWTRCFPTIIKTREWISAGRIGKPLTVRAFFDIKPEVEDWQTWKAGIEHAGGSLRDVGIYSLAMAYMVFPKGPSKVSSTHKLNGEVDESFRMLMEYEDGCVAFISGAFNQKSTLEVEISGEDGRIIFGPELWHPTKTTLISNDGTSEEFVDEYPTTGFQYEIREVQKCLQKGEIECSHFTLDETVEIAKLIETTRKEWGIFYASDKEGEE